MTLFDLFLFRSGRVFRVANCGLGDKPMTKTLPPRYLSAWDKKLRALITQWRQAANEAITAEAVATYGECADALEAVIAVKILVAVCEGCGTEIPMPTKNPRKVSPDLPVGWSQSGTSRHRLPGRPAGARLAAWCQSCRAKKAQP